VIWQNPWAWLGLLAVAIPILIHLLGRDRAPRYSFPSLRFIEMAELPPTRRTRLHDLLLLATRIAIVAIAAAALAQPLVLLASRRAAIDDRLARAIVVDTSASMLRSTPSGARALDSARSAAKQLASDARTSVVIETSSPSAAVDGAVAWLQSQASRRELVVVSDFQVGAIDSSVIGRVPSAIGVRTVPIAIRSENVDLERQSISRDRSIVAHVDVANTPTSVAWTLGSPVDSGARAEPRISLDAANRDGVDAVMSAAKAVGLVTPVDTGPLVTIVFGNAADREALARRATRVSSPALADLVARLRADSLIAPTHGVAAGQVASRGNGVPLLGPVVMDTSGYVVAIAGEDTSSGSHRLLIFLSDTAPTVQSAMLVAAIRRALSVAAPAGELDPSIVASPMIASWQRPPASAPTREMLDSATGPSDARWLWLVVLGLIAIESWLRRERRAASVRREERLHDRAA
jgi:hypothetical protein